MTDTFMTVAVLAVAAPVGAVTRITNVANQRVKESNRIAALVTELSRLGVVARELADGLEVEGAPLDRLRPATLACYGDHRLAMAFAVLGTRVPGIVVADAACVAKTYPTFWDDLAGPLGVTLTAPDAAGQRLAQARRASPASGVRGESARADASVVLIGMRAAGKSTLGAALARALRYEFVVRCVRAALVRGVLDRSV